jgi:ATP-dependent helicase/nuclease subunit A
MGAEFLSGNYPPAIGGADREAGKLVGVLAHRLLEQWDFRLPPQALLDRIEPTVQRFVAGETEPVSALSDSLREILGHFIQSEPYRRLAAATILGREVPFTMSGADGQIVHGVMDVIYRLDDRIWIGDYKTDTVTAKDAQERAERYRIQMTLYKTAAQKSLQLPTISAQVLFLRCGIAIEL